MTAKFAMVEKTPAVGDLVRHKGWGSLVRRVSSDLTMRTVHRTGYLRDNKGNLIPDKNNRLIPAKETYEGLHMQVSPVPGLLAPKYTPKRSSWVFPNWWNPVVEVAKLTKAQREVYKQLLSARGRQAAKYTEANRMVVAGLERQFAVACCGACALPQWVPGLKYLSSKPL